MPEQEFIFSLELSDEAPFERMVQDVARAIISSTGYTGDSGALTDAVEQALAAAGRNSRCAVRFDARDGKLRIAVTGGSHPSWQTAISIPH